jgi:DNA-binding response OmpR family regulator
LARLRCFNVATTRAKRASARRTSQCWRNPFRSSSPVVGVFARARWPEADVRILLVEDEDELAAALGLALTKRAYLVDRVACLADAAASLADTRYQAVLLDRRLPDGDGMSALPLIRRLKPPPPVLMITALQGVSEVVAGLDQGADDYIAKPFEVEELMARLRALLRRPSIHATTTVTFGRLTYAPERREAAVEGVPLTLPRRELLVLEALLRNAGRVATLETLEAAVYGIDDDVDPTSIRPHVSRLRRRLDEAGAGVTIEALRGIGYMLKQG